ncbi:HNH endonuclease signature motif containing protein [Halomicrococcus gelatinilyticus]|uniref:HNH endonuclease signature motif containing protein n=1 Tax=Halomicrococcus gelatinilyticus TaxID=1702103 RepID=UPI002E119BB8
MYDSNRCIICGGAKEANHHVNGDDEDNAAKNVIPVCTSCHNKIHYGTTMQTLPWFAKLPESARRRTLPTVGVERLEGQYKNAFLMDKWMEDAYQATQSALAEAESYLTGRHYHISGIDVTHSFVRKFRSKMVVHSKGNVYEHRTTPIVLEKKGPKCVLRLPELDKHAGGTTRSRKAYETFLTELNKRQGLRGHGGEVTGYEP